jgi:hypothetical protein
MNPGRGRRVHKSRWTAAAITLKREGQAARQSPEQAAILARLPKIPRAEIEARRTPGGGYSFTQEWLEAHGIPYPPPAGWRRTVQQAAGSRQTRVPDADREAAGQSRLRAILEQFPPRGTVEEIKRKQAANAERLKAARQAAMDVTCPHCGSTPGDRCRSTGPIGNSLTYPHASRIRYAGWLP